MAAELRSYKKRDWKRDGRRTHYLIKWKGFPDSEDSWEPLANSPVRGLVKEFQRRNPAKPGEPRRLHFVGLMHVWICSQGSCWRQPVSENRDNWPRCFATPMT
jgi:hypothetical protein